MDYNPSFSSGMTELSLTVMFHTDIRSCFFNLKHFYSLEKLEIHFTDINVYSTDLDILLMNLQSTSTCLKSLKLSLPCVSYEDEDEQDHQYLDVTRLPFSLEHLSVSNLNLFVGEMQENTDMDSIDNPIDNSISQTRDVYTKLTSYFIRLRSLHVDGSYPYLEGKDTQLIRREGYSPHFLLQLPFLEECCFTNVFFYCPPPSPSQDDESNYSYYYQIRRLVLAIHPLHQLKILDLSHINNKDCFSIESWGQKNPNLIFPFLNNSLEQLYLPDSCMELNQYENG